MLRFKKFIFFNLFILFLFIILFFVLQPYCFSFGEPKIVSKLNSAFENIEGINISCDTVDGVQFGDEERIRTGKKIIRGSLFSYGFILAIDLILSAIKSLIS